MSEKKTTILAFVGAVGALITAIGLSTLFIRFAAETYTIAIEEVGSPGIQAAAELEALHRKIGGAGGLRGFLGRSLIANRGLVYSRKRHIIYADGFAHISYPIC